ncbi:DUF4376 domain-containing protein [Lonepinella koalarum]|uniref:DUF4376 domain-containing protein n=1 Tax=Lonepinella koalarum TaxID=53417 RepID=UPI0011E419F2|nr:DUF4376 domain-containing protein [Lonepinella koalarum]TYG33482.1 DUF4376 domain-containing protein [Lonepinella koalarum]
MFYIFDLKGNFIASCDFEPNLEDLSERQESAVESAEKFINPVLHDGLILEKGIAPSTYHHWSGTEWILPTEKQADIKADQQAQMWKQIKQKRYDNGRNGVYVKSVDKWFHTDDVSRQQYTFLRTLDNFPTTQWKVMDNSFVALDKTLLDELSLAIFAHEQADFTNAEMHRVAMLQAENPLDYDYSTGWSEIYEN